ncbi:MAG: ABC transporter ATP-binding protein [Bifidobacteriaceae bacterium]|nr:ABC transporter ATP-binding protein [Bifidobacteriaceae bacterium]
MRFDFETPIRLAQATRSFGAVNALDRVDLEVRAGQTVGLIGPNGSGKSTMINLVAGLRQATSGIVRLFGRDPRDPLARARLGVTPQSSGVAKGLTALDLTRFVAGHFADHRPPLELLAEFGIDHLAKKRIGAMSGGEERLLAVALAFAGNPRLALLDEPSTGLDVNARHRLWDAVEAKSRQGVTVFVTSHYLEEIERLADRVVAIRAGRIVADSPTGELVDRAAAPTIRIETLDDRAIGVLREVGARREGAEVVVASGQAHLALQALADAGVSYTGLDLVKPNLTDAFGPILAGEEVKP